MNKKILELVEKLRLAGKQSHVRKGQEHGGIAEVCPAEYGQTCKCASKIQNEQVDDVAKQLLSELEKQNSPTEQEKVVALLNAIKPVLDSFYSDAEGEKEWATFQDGIMHLEEVVESLEEIERIQR